MNRGDGLVIQAQMGKKTDIKRLFMVRGGTLKMMPSRSPQALLKSSSLISVRYSQMRSRCQFQTRGLTGSSKCQASCRYSTWFILASAVQSRRGIGRRLQLRRSNGTTAFLAAFSSLVFIGRDHGIHTSNDAEYNC